MDYLTTHPFISLAAGFGAALFIIAWLLFNLYRRWADVFGKRAKPSGDVLRDVLRRTAAAEERIAAIEPRVATLEDIGNIAVQKVGFMRFNPFEHTGGDQSFALALLDHGDNGIVLSSLYTRDGVRVYAKEVRHGASKHPLSGEEQKVLEQALNSGSKKREV
ncbi:MAG: DUF4446 family protein [bacterium]|nr:DUF4446 family protein [bacterium]